MNFQELQNHIDAKVVHFPVKDEYGFINSSILSLPPEVVNNSLMVEIGCFHGAGTMMMFRAAHEVGFSNLLCFDTFNGGIDNTQQFLGQPYSMDLFNSWYKNLYDVGFWQAGKIIPVIGNSRVTVPLANLNNNVSFAWIDGDHTYPFVYTDLLNVVPHIKIGGIVAAHDYGDVAAVREAVNEIFNKAHEGEFEQVIELPSEHRVTPGMIAFRRIK